MSTNPKTKQYWKNVKRMALDLWFSSKPGPSNNDERVAQLLSSVPPSTALVAIDRAIEDAEAYIECIERERIESRAAINELKRLRDNLQFPPLRLIRGGL